MGVGAVVTVPGKHLQPIAQWAVVHVGDAWRSTPVEGTVLAMLPPPRGKTCPQVKVELNPPLGAAATEPAMIINISAGVVSVKRAAPKEAAAPAAPAPAAGHAATGGATDMDTSQDHTTREEDEEEQEERIVEEMQREAEAEEAQQAKAPPKVTAQWEDWSSEDLMDFRAMKGISSPGYTLLGPEPLDGSSEAAEVFRHFFPTSLKMDMINATNETGSRKYGSSWKAMDSEEYDLFIAYWLAMGIHHESRAEWWQVEPDHPIFSGHGFGRYGISRNRFDHIVSALSFIPGRVATPLEDVRHMQEAFNRHMVERYNPSWLVCVDESMTPWYHPGDCPAWIILKDKPTPRGMEFHVTADHSTNVIFRAELVRDPSATRFQNVCSDRVSAITLRLTETLFHSYRVVILDSFFGTLETVLQLHKNGLYSTVVLKKKRNWPALTDAGALEERSKMGEVGNIVARAGSVTDARAPTPHTMPVIEVAQKDVRHSVLLLSSWGSSAPYSPGGLQRRVVHVPLTDSTLVHEFLRAHLMHFFYLARHCADDCNNIRGDKNSMEKIWQTKDWRLRAFGFFVSVCEANALNIFKNLHNDSLSMQAFRRKLVTELIPVPPSTPAVSTTQAPSRCLHINMPLHTRYIHGKFVKNPDFSAYYSRKCRFCDHRTRMLCLCDPSVSICSHCIGEHHESM